MDWLAIFRRKKEDSFADVIEVMQTINNRKLKHLKDCVEGMCKGAKVPYSPPPSFITDLEAKILERFEGEKAERLKKLILPSFEEKINE